MLNTQDSLLNEQSLGFTGAMTPESPWNLNDASVTTRNIESKTAKPLK